MSWGHLRDETRRARKMSKCFLCGELIHVGDTYVARTGTDEREIVTMKMHPECEEESSNWDMDDWESISPYEMERPVRQEEFIS